MDRIDLRPALWGLGLCGVLSSITTLTNILLPRFYAAPANFEARVALLDNTFYMARQWILLVHPFLTLTGALGILLYKFAEHPGKTLTGFLFSFAEKITEFFLGTTILFVVLGQWVRGYGRASGAADRERLRANAQLFYDYLEGAFFLLWVTFTLAAILYGLALWSGGRFDRAVAVSYFIVAVLTLLMLAGDYAGQQSWVRPVILWCYAPFLTLNRLLAGLLIMRAATGAMNACGIIPPNRVCPEE